MDHAAVEFRATRFPVVAFDPRAAAEKTAQMDNGAAGSAEQTIDRPRQRPRRRQGVALHP